VSNYKSYSDTPGVNSLTSVGIDIGTTSTHLVFSKLTLANEAGASQIPKLAIREREILFQSNIHLTPLNDDGTINGAGVAKLLRDEYEKSGFTPDDINCGAVIITGETALLRNAEQVLQEISSLAGDFVAASAGPDLESALAGRGSGARQHSLENHNTICNIDIGGGTTNIAVFRNGELIETACLRIGGRCFRFDRKGSPAAASASGKLLLASFEKSVRNQSQRSGRTQDFYQSHEAEKVNVHRQFSTIGQLAAEAIFDFVTTPRFTLPEGLEELVMTGALEVSHNIDEYWLSGGVAELVKNPGSDPFIFEDFGWFLAKGLNDVLIERKITHRVAHNPLRATVLGAGSYSVQLSGNTVSIGTAKLPLKGIPLIRPFSSQEAGQSPNAKTVSAQLKKAISISECDVTGKAAAIILELSGTPRYQTLKAWSEALGSALESSGLGLPYILIVGSDSAMALGQLLKGRLKGNEVVVLDGIDLSNGDYIDIGKPLGGGNTIPVTVKSLVFTNERLREN
jgi:ethanolamine utilization protein EutA